MNPNNEQPSFMDRGTLAAVVLILIFWFGWSRFMDSKYPKAQVAATGEQVAPAEKQDTSKSGASTAPIGANTVTPTEVTQSGVADEKVIAFSSDNLTFELSSRGMGLKNVVVGKYQTRDGQPIRLGEVAHDYPFSTAFNGSPTPIEFNIEKTGDNTFIGRAVAGGVTIEKSIEVDPATYSLKMDVRASGITGAFGGFSVALNDKIHEAVSSNFLSPSYDHQDWYVAHEDTKTRTVISKESGNDVRASSVTLAALSAHYFTLAIADNSDLSPRFESKIAVGATDAVGRLIYQPINQADTFSIKYTGYAGPKALGVLTQVDEKLGKVIDYGMFAVIAKPILGLLRLIFAGVGNWGWAIVILTIFVRLLVLPFNVFSMKSMKAMQRIQPEMNRIKEKYKDKPTEQRLQMNAEIMELMKKNKANPLGGCLPMLLQLPVFFALYQVLGQSIELYRVPFIFWIHDLSSKDPYFVLPVLMGVSMFFQQKLTPTTMDPQQAKIMKWMPVLFSFMMLSLPSGLTLYIFVSTLFAICQQYILMRDKAPVQTVKEAKA